MYRTNVFSGVMSLEKEKVYSPVNYGSGVRRESPRVATRGIFYLQGNFIAGVPV